MRVAILISFAAFALTLSAASADGPFIECAAGARVGYIIPENYAGDAGADFVASIPGRVRIEGFWTPSQQDVAVADRVFRELIEDAVKDPTLLFPDLAPNPDPAARVDRDAAAQLEKEQKELVLVSRNYDDYSRQYVGIIISGGKKLVFCNYSNGTKADPSTNYIFIQKLFVADGTVHFLQCRFDPDAKTCSNVSMIGSWQ